LLKLQKVLTNAYLIIRCMRGNMRGPVAAYTEGKENWHRNKKQVRA